MIAHLFCELHPEQMLIRPVDTLGRWYSGAREWCPKCRRRSRLYAIMAELRRAQSPITYRTTKSKRFRRGQWYEITRWWPIRAAVIDRRAADTPIYSGSSGNPSKPRRRGSRAFEAGRK